MRSTMANGADGACTPLDDFTDDQVAVRGRKARDLRNRLDDTPEETWSAYQSHILPEVLGYLDRIAQEAEFELTLRDQPFKLSRLHQEFSTHKKSEVSPIDDPGMKLFMIKGVYILDEIKRTEAIPTEVPKSLAEIRTKLAAISSQEINSYMDSLGVHKLDPLRPPHPASANDEICVQPKQAARDHDFRVFVGDWRNKQQSPISDDKLLELANQCDDEGFPPIPPFINKTIYKQIKKWNDTYPEKEIKKFVHLIVHFRKMEPDGSKRPPRKRNEPVFDLQPFRSFLSYTAKRLSRKAR